MKRIFWLLFVGIIIVPFQNCSPPKHDPKNRSSYGPLQANFTQIKAQIFDSQCLQCHSTGDPNFSSYTALLSGTTIVPGAPNSSPLYLSVKNGSMPQGSGPLTSAQQQAIFDWIADGALEEGLTGTAPLLSAVSISTSQINLNWVDNTSNESGFMIERATTETGPFVQIQEVAENTVTISDLNLTAATTYHYRIRAFNSVQSSEYSNIASATTQNPPASPPATPSGLIAQTISSTSLKISWVDNSNNETAFKIERSLSGGVFSQIATVAAGILFYENSGLTPATNYSYRVRASNSAGDSSYSNTATAATLAPPSDNFASLKANIFDPKCVSCHSGNGAKGAYKMSSYTEILTRVTPFNASVSKLYQRTADGSMPKGTPLNSTEIQLIQSWVNRGAPND